ncbi:DUF5719 family protein [Cellulomonas sp. KRMCY2]|uniref:DUF5719 family protein n=1 Tax=Cellulomonas sp. KRMCY2 TaxID=1304865 RepID=UPI00045E6B95|nr:DUF5719 family protein [Cellulomonas sp. KRMCY2]
MTEPTEPTETTEPTESRPPVRRAVRVRSLLARAGSAVLVLGVTAAVVAMATVEPVPAQVPVPPLLVEVPAPTAVVACPGTTRVPTEPEAGGDVVYDPQFDPAPGETVARLQAITAAPSATTPGEETSAGDPAATGTLDPLDATAAALAVLEPVGAAAAAGIGNLTGAVVVRGEPRGAVPAWVAGAVSSRTAEGDLRGLAAASCQRPGTETWLVGGSTSLGSSSRLVLQNPGRTPALVRLELWGPSGAVEPAGSPEYLVPAGQERVVLLEGVAAEQRRIVARVTSSGGLVTAYLQDSELRGLVPAGVDLVVAGQAPATHQVVPGLSVMQTAADGVDTSVLRLLVPGAEPGSAAITLLGAQGPVTLPGTASVSLEAGAVLDVPLGGLPAGDYTVVVDADVPVVAGALLTRGAGVGGPDDGSSEDRPLERAWAASAPTGAGLLALPAGSLGRLLVAAVPDPALQGPAEATLVVIGADGAVLGERSLSIPAGTTTALPLDALLDRADDAAGAATPAELAHPAGVVLRTADPRLTWAAVLVTPDAAGDLVSVLTPVAPQVVRAEVPVRVR